MISIRSILAAGMLSRLVWLPMPVSAEGLPSIKIVTRSLPRSETCPSRSTVMPGRPFIAESTEPLPSTIPDQEAVRARLERYFLGALAGHDNLLRGPVKGDASEVERCCRLADKGIARRTVVTCCGNAQPVRAFRQRPDNAAAILVRHRNSGWLIAVRTLNNKGGGRNRRACVRIDDMNRNRSAFARNRRR